WFVERDVPLDFIVYGPLTVQTFDLVEQNRESSQTYLGLQAEIDALPSDAVDVLPLSPLQEGLLFHSEYEQSTEDVYIARAAMDLRGPLDIPTLRSAAEALPRRYPNLRAYHSEHGITTLAYHPLTVNSDIEFMAQKYGKTPAQIVVRWHLELKHVVAVGPEVMDEALGVFDFELAEDDVLSLSEVD
ncbi:hypothetical protein ACFQ1S_13455, partial [Kibdelosporangium lantanae]